MFRKALAFSIATVLLAVDLSAASNVPVVKTDWTGFRQQVADRHLQNRHVRISLVRGGEIKARLERVEENGIVVESNAATKQWSSGAEETTVPRDGISSVEFRGRVGKGELIGTLVGLGAGGAAVGAAAADWSGGNCEGPACGGVFALIPIAGVGGWLIGRATTKPAPTFIIKP